MAFNFSGWCNGTSFDIVPHQNGLVVFRRLPDSSCCYVMESLAKALVIADLEVSATVDMEWVRVEAKRPTSGEAVDFIVLAADIENQIIGCAATHGDVFTVTNLFS